VRSDKRREPARPLPYYLGRGRPNKTYTVLSPTNRLSRLTASPEPFLYRVQARLFSCDEHAFCHGCQYGNQSYCEAVATYYGGVGVPYTYNGTHHDREFWDGIEYIGANAAFQAINNDWDFW